MPTNNSYFMTPQYFKDNTVVNGNVDDELITPFIIIAENQNIERVIGTALFDELVDQIEDYKENSTPIDPNNIILLEKYINPALLQWTMFHSLPFLNYKLTNKTVAKKNSDNSDSSDVGEISYLRNVVSNNAEYLSTRLTNFLKENKDTYPLFGLPGTGCDTIKPSDDNYFSGFQL
jgi:hypothetical protein